MRDPSYEKGSKALKGLIVQGTLSDAGKSLITTALCRIFANEALNSAPYKSQNMSSNFYVTAYGTFMEYRLKRLGWKLPCIGIRTFLNLPVI
ncbi:hypothetical protein ACQCVE_17375 [Metabacillus sp. 113a]|uniref:nucleotide-binding protein n=1 Tax=Metabacillus sp. 113a TaxID=3404706 RepID=UPI003CE776DF